MSNKQPEASTRVPIPELDVNCPSFGQRLRQIRKEHNLSQEELAEMLGTFKQVISKYERGQSSPKLSHVAQFAKRLNVSTDYLLGTVYDTSSISQFWSSAGGKPFYLIFCDIVYRDMGLAISEVVHLTGLSLSQVEAIVVNRMEIAPLNLAMQLSDALNVPLSVWAGHKVYEPSEISVRAYEVARAYTNADLRQQTITRLVLGLDAET